MSKLNETITKLETWMNDTDGMETEVELLQCLPPFDAIHNALDLLKEQKNLMIALDQSNSANEHLNEEVDKLNALLRQQQDEIAMLTKKAKSPTWRRGKAFCGSCGGCLENKEKHSADIVSSIRFCKWCGTPVDW